jgi:hypothetical protein
MTRGVWREFARRRIRRLWIAPALVGLLVAGSTLYILLFTPPAGPVTLPPLDPALARRVYVLVYEYHSSILVEQPAGWSLGPEGDEEAPFVEYGWGDRSFYMESNFWPHSLFAAAFLPTPSVAYVCGHRIAPNEEVVVGDVYVIECDAVRFERLVRVLEAQMVRGVDGGRPRAFPATPEYPGRFYPGREYYVVWWNCNTWTARMLDEAGFDVSPALVMAAGQVGGRLREFQLLPRKVS